MIDLNKFQALKEKAEKAKQERDKAKGVMATLQTELEEEFGVTTIKEAKKLLSSLQEEQQTAEDQFNKDLEAFENEFGEL